MGARIPCTEREMIIDRGSRPYLAILVVQTTFALVYTVIH